VKEQKAKEVKERKKSRKIGNEEAKALEQLVQEMEKKFQESECQTSAKQSPRRNEQEC